MSESFDGRDFCKGARRANSHPDLQARDKEPHQRGREIGFRSATRLLAIGEK